MATKAAIAAAVNYLIESTNYASLVREITNCIELWETRPMSFSNHLEVLNSLIEVGLESREAFEALLKLAEDRRKTMPEQRRIDYQREMMRARRSRTRKALEVYELQRGRLPSAEKTKYTKQLWERWNKAKEEFMRKKMPESWHERMAATREFWEGIDAVLENNLRQARKNPKH